MSVHYRHFVVISFLRSTRERQKLVTDPRLPVNPDLAWATLIPSLAERDKHVDRAGAVP